MFKSVFASLALLVGSGTAFGQFFIDNFQNNFSSPPLSVGTLNSPSVSSQAGLAGVLGGQRTATLTSTGDAAQDSTATIENGWLLFSNPAGRNAALDLNYGGVDPLNFNASQFNAIWFSAIMDAGTNAADVSIVAASGAVAETFTFSLLQGQSDYLVPFSQFPGVNFADLDRLEFKIEALSGSPDISMTGGIQLVPEPEAWGIAAIGTLLTITLIARSRRRSPAIARI